ncbi:hypothetical protein J6590_093705 [Homalodisca vitripennis]|nr:hypothetical protein J6590_093705 [Homalodisca vitripennis]
MSCLSARLSMPSGPRCFAVHIARPQMWSWDVLCLKLVFYNHVLSLSSAGHAYWPSLFCRSYGQSSNSREDDLQMAAKIGSALVAENELLKVEKLELQNKLISMEGKMEEVENNMSKYLTKIENLLQLNADVQAQLDKEKKFRIEVQNSSEDHDLKLGQMINNYAKRIAELEKTNTRLQEKIQNIEITATICKDSATQTSSPTKDAQVFEANQTTVLLGISEINSKLAQMELTIKTLASRVNQTCSKKIENILTTPSTEQSSPPTSGASQTCNQKLILYTRTTEAESSIPLPTTDASLPITPGVSQTCRKKLKHMRTTPLKKQNPSSTAGMSQK